MISAKTKLQWYSLLSGGLIRIFGPRRAKLFFEHAYWRWEKLREGKLSNEFYEPFYTMAFGLSKSDYEGKDVLDVGCGPRGSLDWADEARSRVGIDPLADRYRKLNTRLKMELVQGAAEQMPFEDASFDLVCCFNALDHVDDLQDSLDEICRVLRPGGRFLLITDIHGAPAICEPTVIGWDLASDLQERYEVVDEKRLRRLNGVYESVRSAIPFKEDSDEAYGLLQLHLIKRQG